MESLIGEDREGEGGRGGRGRGKKRNKRSAEEVSLDEGGDENRRLTDDTTLDRTR